MSICEGLERAHQLVEGSHPESGHLPAVVDALGRHEQRRVPTSLDQHDGIREARYAVEGPERG